MTSDPRRPAPAEADLPCGRGRLRRIGRRLSRFVWLLVVSLLPAVALPRTGYGAAPPAGSGLETTGGRSTAAILEGDDVDVWVTIRNAGEAPVHDVRVLLPDLLPGYTWVSRCWCPAAGSTCLPPAPAPAGGAAPGCDRVVAELAPGQSLAVWGRLKAGAAHTTRMLHLAVRWTRDGVESQAMVPLGEARVQHWAGRVWSEVQNLFGVTVALTFITFLYNSLSSRREKRREEREKRLEALRREQSRQAEAERAQLSETWNLMLPQSHRVTTRHYVPILAAVRALPGAVEKALAATEPAAAAARLRAFYVYMLFERRVRELVTSGSGGFYFKDRIGEQLALLAYQRFRMLFPGEDPVLLQAWSRALSGMAVHESLAGFAERAASADEPGPSLRTCQTRFDAWIADPAARAEGLSCLGGLRAVMDYEINRPYENWYGAREKLEIDVDSEARLLALAEAEEQREPRRRGLVERVRAYLSRGTGS